MNADQYIKDQYHNAKEDNMEEPKRLYQYIEALKILKGNFFKVLKLPMEWD